MESLVLLVCIIVCTVLVSGPAAVLLAYAHWNILAVLFAACACWSGFYFFITVDTSFRYLSLASAALGLWALFKVTRDMCS